MAASALISERQLTANRANAQNSTGPRTAEGKSRTRLNGLSHGLTGQTALLPTENRAAYDQHRAAFLDELKPEGILEIQIAHHIADGHWRLDRIKAIETNIYALGIEAHAGEFHDNPEWNAAVAQAQTFLDQSPELNRLSLYEQRISRAVHAWHKELGELQRLRKVAASKPRNGSGFSTHNFASQLNAGQPLPPAKLAQSTPEKPPLTQAA